jgi:hypothetical protein
VKSRRFAVAERFAPLRPRLRSEIVVAFRSGCFVCCRQSRAHRTTYLALRLLDGQEVK